MVLKCVKLNCPRSFLILHPCDLHDSVPLAQGLQVGLYSGLLILLQEACPRFVTLLSCMAGPCCGLCRISSV